MGPDLKEARKRGQELGIKLLARVIKDNNMWDVTAPKMKGHKFILLPNSENRWDKAKRKFVRAIEELFEEDACNGF